MARITELSQIEFTGSLTEAFDTFSKNGSQLARRLSFEVGAGATDSQAAMESLKGHPLLFGLDAKVKARKVAKHLKRGSQAADGCSKELAKFITQYKRTFPES